MRFIGFLCKNIPQIFRTSCCITGSFDQAAQNSQIKADQTKQLYSANMVFLHGDALNLPFKPKIFNTIISLNLLHVLIDVKKVLLGLRNVLTDNGTMSFTTLIENNRFADKYLNIMGKKGLSVPRKAHELFEIFNDISMPVKFDIKGNMAFIFYDN